MKVANDIKTGEGVTGPGRWRGAHGGGRKECTEPVEVREARYERWRKAAVVAGTAKRGGSVGSEWKLKLVSALCSQWVQCD